MISLYLIFPAICMFIGSLIFYLLDSEPERFDRQTQGLVVACVDETDSTLNTDPVVGKNGLEAW